MPFLQGPLGVEFFSRTDNTLYWLSLFGNKGAQRGNWECLLPSNRLGTHSRLFPTLVDFETRNGTESVDSGHGLGRFGIGGRVGKGGEACIARECTGVIFGLWCS